MNVFVQLLADGRVDPAPDTAATKVAVEDNVGESVHLHLRNLRFEMTTADFERFADGLATAREELDGDR